MSKHRVEAYVTATVREFWDVELPDRWAEFDADEQREFLMLAAGGGGDMDALGEVWKVTGADVGLEDEIVDTSDREWTLYRVTELPAPPSPEAGAMSTADGLGSTEDDPRCYCPECHGPAVKGSRNRVSATHVEYRCAAGHGHFTLRDKGV